MAKGRRRPDWRPYLARIRELLEEIRALGLRFLDESEIHPPSQPGDTVFLLGAGRWGRLSDVARRLQMDLLKDFEAYRGRSRLLWDSLPADLRADVREAEEFIAGFVERTGSVYEIPATIAEAKVDFQKRLDDLLKVLVLLDREDQRGVIVFIDTNAITECPDLSLYAANLGGDAFDAVLPSTVLNELEALKRKPQQRQFKEKVARALRRIKGWRDQGDLSIGVKVGGRITVRVLSKEPDFQNAPPFLDASVPDDRIILRALEVQRERPAATVLIATRDTNLQTKATLANLGWIGVPTGPSARPSTVKRPPPQSSATIPRTSPPSIPPDYLHEDSAYLRAWHAEALSAQHKAEEEATYAASLRGDLRGPETAAREAAAKAQWEAGYLHEVVRRVDEGYPYLDRFGFESTLEQAAMIAEWDSLTETPRDIGVSLGDDRTTVRLPVEAQAKYAKAKATTLFDRFEVCHFYETFEDDDGAPEEASTYWLVAVYSHRDRSRDRDAHFLISAWVPSRRRRTEG